LASDTYCFTVFFSSERSTPPRALHSFPTRRSSDLINQAHRLNWIFGGSQEPLYFYLPTTVADNGDGTFTFAQQIERFVIRDAFVQGFYPFSRFDRVELGGHFSNISQAVLQQRFLVDSFSNLRGVADPETIDGPS